MGNDIPELTDGGFSRAISGVVRRRLCHREVRSGSDVTALRRFVGMTPEQFARAMGVRVDTIRNWERGRRRPNGTAVALFQIVACDPRALRRLLSPFSRP